MRRMLKLCTRIDGLDRAGCPGFDRDRLWTGGQRAAKGSSSSSDVRRVGSVDRPVSIRQFDRRCIPAWSAPPANAAVRMCPTGPPTRSSTRSFPSGSPTAIRTNDPTRESLEVARPRAAESWKISPWTGDWYARADWEKELGPNFFENGVFHRRYGGDLQGVIDQARLSCRTWASTRFTSIRCSTPGRCTSTTAIRFITSIRTSVPIRRATSR